MPILADLENLAKEIKCLPPKVGVKALELAKDAGAQFLKDHGGYFPSVDNAGDIRLTTEAAKKFQEAKEFVERAQGSC